MNRFVVVWGDVCVYDVKFNVYKKVNEMEIVFFGFDRFISRNGYFILYFVWSGR